MSSGKTRTRRGARASAHGEDEAASRRLRGLPNPTHVVSEKAFRSPKGARYRILRTTETDAYDPPETPGKRPR